MMDSFSLTRQLQQRIDEMESKPVSNSVPGLKDFWVRKIVTSVGDPKMHQSIARKAAEAFVSGRLSEAELAELCDCVAGKRERGELRRPGAYFLVSIKRLFQEHEIPW